MQCNPTKISQDSFLETDKMILKFVWKSKGPKIGKTILKKNNKSWRTHSTRSQDLLYKANQDNV